MMKTRAAGPAFVRERDADRLEQALGRLPRPRKRPAVIVLVGLPGSGKSHFARQLKRRYPAAILDSDALRRVLFADPQHNAVEHRRLFPAMHVLIRRLLAKGISVIVDATNLKEANRRPLYVLAEEAGARLLVVRVTAPVTVIRRRLVDRSARRNRHDRSTADVEVFQAMKDDYERPRRRYLVADTTRDPSAVLDKICALLQS